MVSGCPTAHRDETTIEESMPLTSAAPSSSSTSPGVLHRLWTAATSPFRGCVRVPKEEEDQSAVIKRLQRSLAAKDAKIYRLESIRDSKAAAIKRLDSRSAADRDHFSTSSGISSSRSRHHSEHNESIGSADSGHGKESAEDEAPTHRSFLEEILEAKGKLRPVEKDLSQVLKEITDRR